jgi:antitoxin (DNA-binding transcriptional repressor) of toxin-antitoxin stability system
MNNIIGLKDLRENLEKYEKQIQAGQSFIVMKRSKPIFTISPVENDEWETVIDFTKFRKGGIPASELIERLKNLN